MRACRLDRRLVSPGAVCQRARRCAVDHRHAARGDRASGEPRPTDQAAPRSHEWPRHRPAVAARCRAGWGNRWRRGSDPESRPPTLAGPDRDTHRASQESQWLAPRHRPPAPRRAERSRCNAAASRSGPGGSIAACAGARGARPLRARPARGRRPSPHARQPRLDRPRRGSGARPTRHARRCPAPCGARHGARRPCRTRAAGLRSPAPSACRRGPSGRAAPCDPPHAPRTRWR